MLFEGSSEEVDDLFGFIARGGDLSMRQELSSKIPSLQPLVPETSSPNNPSDMSAAIAIRSNDTETTENGMIASSNDLSNAALLSLLNANPVSATEIQDDAEGYYCYRVGELLNGRYALLGCYGKGVFSTVVKAKDLKGTAVGDILHHADSNASMVNPVISTAVPREVAIKVLRNNEAMKRMGLKEILLLKELAATDPKNKYNVVRLLDHFEDRGHLCLVFEAMGGGNLREILRKYGTKIGLKIQAVRFYGLKLMHSLKLLRKCKIVHADIKLDNILLSEDKKSLRLGDFGSASPASENTITPYLVSRFYRAPEIILGLSYSYGIDIWSVGCCLFEICTGKILFPGKTNNEMLHMFMEISGPIPKRLLKKAEFSSQYFDENGNFKRALKDKLTQKEYVKLVTFSKPSRDLKEELLASPYEMSIEDKRMIVQLHDLLNKIFVFDPSQRITVEDALAHPFFNS